MPCATASDPHSPCCGTAWEVVACKYLQLLKTCSHLGPPAAGLPASLPRFPPPFLSLRKQSGTAFPNIFYTMARGAKFRQRPANQSRQLRAAAARTPQVLPCAQAQACHSPEDTGRAGGRGGVQVEAVL